MSPLEQILAWWQQLAEWPREMIAADFCLRVLDDEDPLHRCLDLFPAYLSAEVSPAGRNVGRATVVRGVIDLFIAKVDLEDSLGWHLNAVEGDDPFLKRVANEAIGRHAQVAREWDNTVDTWRALRAGALSDGGLLSWERDQRFPS